LVAHGLVVVEVMRGEKARMKKRPLQTASLEQDT
jgi:hypothetical protein